MTDFAIELDRVETRVGEFHLGPIDLAIPRGAIFALIGPNGAGKTTTLDLLMGMGQPERGHIRMLGLDLAENEVEIKRRTAYVNPDLNYQAWGSVGEAVSFVRGFYPDWDADRCARLLGEFGLGNNEAVAALSFGSRIKLALVLALSRDAELLLLDEPTVGLDAVSRRLLFAELLSFIRRESRTILISSHQLADMERFADHVAIMSRGTLMAVGRMDELVDRYGQAEVRFNGSLALPPGMRVLQRDGSRARVLIDKTSPAAMDLAAAGVEVIAETPLTLEELFIALVSAEAAVAMRVPTP